MTIKPSQRPPLALLALLVSLHIINHVDRHLVASLAPQIMADLQLSKSQFGAIAGIAFSLVYAVTALFAGLLADRIGRVRVLTGGAGIWSGFTALCGLTQGFWSLLAMRPFVAMGEATLVPTATNIIAARSTERSRATFIGIFFAGIPMGVGCSYMIAAWLGPTIGWRHCFFLMAGIGVVATLLASRIKDVRSTALTSEQTDTTSNRAKLATLARTLRSNARLRWTCIAIVLLHAHMATGAFTQLWLTGDKGFTIAQAGSIYGTMFILLGLAGSTGSGMLTDWLHQSRGADRARTVAWLFAALIPLILLYRLAPGGSAPMIIGMAASVLWFTCAYGPCFAIVEKELPEDLKATATGINMLAINVLMTGLLTFAIGAAAQGLSNIGYQGWTIPLIGADAIAMLGVGALFLAARSKPAPLPATAALA